MIIVLGIPSPLSREFFWFLRIPLIIRLVIFALGFFAFVFRERKESVEAYECGFDPFIKNKRSFCIRFFNIAILYLLIDLEIALILPFFLKIFLFNNLATRGICLLLSGLVFFLIFLLWVEFYLGGLR